MEVISTTSGIAMFAEELLWTLTCLGLLIYIIGLFKPWQAVYPKIKHYAVVPIGIQGLLTFLAHITVYYCLCFYVSDKYEQAMYENCMSTSWFTFIIHPVLFFVLSQSLWIGRLKRSDAYCITCFVLILLIPYLPYRNYL